MHLTAARQHLSGDYVYSRVFLRDAAVISMFSEAMQRCLGAVVIHLAEPNQQGKEKLCQMLQLLWLQLLPNMGHEAADIYNKPVKPDATVAGYSVRK